MDHNGFIKNLPPDCMKQYFIVITFDPLRAAGFYLTPRWLHWPVKVRSGGVPPALALPLSPCFGAFVHLLPVADPTVETTWW